MHKLSSRILRLAPKHKKRARRMSWILLKQPEKQFSKSTEQLPHVLRIDLAGRPTKDPQALTAAIGTFTDPRLSIFAGNLDFAS
ncbi:hypothetical protein ACEPAI_3241 [Sanghuangporus weigelae]